MKTVRTLFLAAAVICGLILTLPAHKADAAGPNPVVVMETSVGRVMVMLSPKGAPKTVENFLKYVEAGFYDNTVFHRVIKQRVPVTVAPRDMEKNTSMNIVQGGGFDLNLRKKAPLFPPVVNEAATSMQNDKGTIAMARAGAPDSATSEFFFNMEDNPALNRSQSVSKLGAGRYSSSTEAGYCAFGKVIRGMKVLEQIHEGRTVSRGRMEDVPVDPVILKKAYLAR